MPVKYKRCLRKVKASAKKYKRKVNEYAVCAPLRGKHRKKRR